jgi:hypothetical protein
MGEVGQTVGEVRRKLQVKVSEPRVECAGIFRVESLPGEDPTGCFAQARIQELDVVEPRIQPFIRCGVDGGDELRHVRAWIVALDPRRSELPALVELSRDPWV